MELQQIELASERLKAYFVECHHAEPFVQIENSMAAQKLFPKF
jgi:hypothetical protein